MKSLGKKAKFDYWYSWAEFYAVLLLVIGFLIGITIRSILMNFIVIFLAGLMAGRLLYGRKKKHKFTHYLIVIGFLLGYLLGTFQYRKIIAFLFFSAALISYYLHDKGYIDKIIPFKDPHKELWK